MKKRQKKSDNYFDRLKEWQKHQYDPGYYTGGKIPPIITHPGNPKLLGLFMVISSFIGGIIITIFFINIFQVENIIPLSLLAIFLYGLGIANFIGGIKYLKKGTSEKHYKKLKKRFFTISSIIIISIVLFVSVNTNFLEKNASIYINNVNELKLFQENSKNYVIPKKGKMVFTTDNGNYFDIWAVKVTDGNESFKIYYKWNILNPNNGKIIKVEVLH